MSKVMNHNHLVSAFRKQNKTTIWRHLDALAENNAVYSTHLKGFSPALQDNDVYIYATAWSVVVVCIDRCNADTELADEAPFMDGDPLYFSESSRRVSPVWRLSNALKRMEERLEAQDYYIISRKEKTLLGVLLTDATFINRDEMEDTWKSMGVTVIDGLSYLKGRELGVNDTTELTCRLLVDIMINAEEDIYLPTGDDAAEPEPTPTDNDSDDDGDLEEQYAALLQKFLDDAHDGESDPFTTGDDDEDDDEFDDDDGDDDPSNGFDPTTVDLPDGDITQNGNVVVKVDILPPISNPREELEKLVGCNSIKKRMDQLLALTEYNKMMHENFPGGKSHAVSLHSVFMGRPGTGKTTVCKIFGSLLRQAGVLSKGHVVMCNRGTFIGTLWGDEERSLRQVVEKAQGGVLMIDEAYLLNSSNHNDPGRMVIPMLMDMLANEHMRDIAVVLCGYKDPMNRLLEMNQGLNSRFPNRFEFDDFTIDQLLEITRRRVGEYAYHFTRQAWDKYKQVLLEAYKQRDPDTWGNARFVANQLERIYIQHATRIVKHKPSDKKRMLMITPADVLPIEVPTQKPRIGF